MCQRKPIVVTCGVDRSIKVWNYLTLELELSKEFEESVHSVALHPTGNKWYVTVSLFVNIVWSYSIFIFSSLKLTESAEKNPDVNWYDLKNVSNWFFIHYDIRNYVLKGSVISCNSVIFTLNANIKHLPYSINM